MDTTLNTQQTEFASIVLGKPSDSTQSLIYSQSQTRIRQHAMRMYFRKKRSNAPSDDAPTEVVLQPQSMLTGKFRFKPLLKKGKAKQMKVISKAKDNGDKREAISPTTATFIVPAIYASKVDPFQVLPIKIGPSQEHLLKLIYMTSYMQNPVVLNPEASPLSYAFTDAALLHALLSLVGQHYDLSIGMKISPLCLIHRGEALRIINERITKAPLRLSDATIGAVAALATFDLIDGRSQNARWNIQGLQQMVVQRGGIQILGKEARDVCGSWLLQRAICWSDLCAAAFAYEKPQFPVTVFRSPVSGPHPPKFSFSSSIESVLDAISELSVTLSRPNIPLSQRLSFSNNLYLVEHSLHSLPQDPYQSPYYEPIRIAAIVYIYLFLRQIPHTAGIYEILLRRLHTSLGKCITKSGQLSNLCLLWVCFIGAASSKPLSERDGYRGWWIGILRNVCRTLNLTSKDDFEDYLNRVVKMGSLCRESSNTIWTDVNNSHGRIGDNKL